MKKRELRSIIRMLAKENSKLKRKMKELKESDDIVVQIDDVVGRWFRVEGIENADQAMHEINDIIVNYTNGKSQE